VIEVRPKTVTGFAAVRGVGELAFEHPAEAGLVRRRAESARV
jgi:hypothetical protein